MANAALDSAQWSDLVQRLAPSLDAEATFGTLERAYDEPHRAYHGARHIVDCLAQFADARDLCARPDEVEFALWLHDAVYKTRGGDSEEKSADLASQWLREGNADVAVPGRVHQMILATQHGGPPVDEGPDADLARDTNVMLDVDLSILGRDEAVFDEYELNVRAEFRWVPGPMFRSKRAELLEQFLERPRLFVTDRFFERYEAKARANLTRSIESLRRA